MPDRHALLAPSSANRWLYCTASALDEKGVNEKESPYAREGTQAHKIAAIKLSNYFFQDDAPFSCDGEMDEMTDAYLDYVQNIVKEESQPDQPEPSVHVEVFLDLSNWAPRCFGTSDCVIEGSEILHIIDFKYGTGIRVEAEENEQLKLYALGALDGFDWMGKYQKIRLHIVQPRLNYFDYADYTRSELIQWGQQFVKPAAYLAYSGQGIYHPGSCCRFCRVRLSCNARREKLIEDYSLAIDQQLEDEYILEHLPEWKSFLSQFQQYATKRAIKGDVPEGYKLVQSSGKRILTEPEKVASLLEKEGIDPWKPRELQSISVLEKQMGRKKFRDLCGGYIHHQSGKIQLVPQSDIRPEVHFLEAEFEVLEDEPDETETNLQLNNNPPDQNPEKKEVNV